MEHYIGIDASLERSSICVVDSAGRIVREAKVPSEPAALVDFFARLGVAVARIGLEAGPLSQWLHAGLTKAGFEVVLLETRHVKAALSAMIVKTDRKDARGIAQLLRMGWFRPVHRKSPPAQEVRALLVGRKLLQGKLADVELSIRGILRGFGLKLGEVSKGRFAARVRELVAGQPAHAGTGGRADAARPRGAAGRVPRPAPGRAGDRPPGRGLPPADDGARRRRAGGGHVRLGGRRSHPVPALAQPRCHFGLTPERCQSGETDVSGGISRAGDAMVRTALYEAANVMLTRAGKFSTLKRWGLDVAKRRGMRRAKVALARKLSTVLHRLWIDGSEFRFGGEAAAA